MTRPLSNSHLIPSNGPPVASAGSLSAWRLLLSHPCSSFVLVMRVHVADQFQACVPVIPGRLSPGARSFPKLRGVGPRAPLRRPVLPLGGSSAALSSVFANSFFKQKKKFFFMIFTVEKFLVFVSAGSQICAPSLLSSSFAQTSQTNWVYVQRPPPGPARAPAGGPLAIRGSRGQPRWCVPGVLSLGTVSRCSVGFSVRTPPSLG